MPDIQLESFQGKYLKAYAEFAREAWGESCYQSSEKYLNWLYKENPCRSSSEEDLILGLAEDKVVGCIHKLRLMWKNKNKVIFIPTIHNLVISEKYRKQWFGIKILKLSFARENHVLVPGVAENQGNLYKFLKCQQVGSSWYRKILTPVKGAIYLSLKKISGFNVSPALFTSPDFQDIKNLNNSLKISLEPNETVAQKIISQLNIRSSGTLSPYWTLEQFQWRFFHPLGPRHLLVYKDSGHEINDFLILSLGPRRGLNIARIVEMEASSSVILESLIQAAEKIIKIYGGHILLIFSASSKMNNMLLELKFKLIRNSPKTYFYHQDKSDFLQPVSFNGSAGDFGFEAIP
jgi:hypothetical protein